MGRALIIRPPHIDRILDGLKTWELRSTKTNVRGRIGLIEAGSGMIVGECEIVGCTEYGNTDGEFLLHKDKHQCSDASLAAKYPYAWVLENAKRYDEPIPYDHPQGAVIWVKLDHIVEPNKMVGKEDV